MTGKLLNLKSSFRTYMVHIYVCTYLLAILANFQLFKLIGRQTINEIFYGMISKSKYLYSGQQFEKKKVYQINVTYQNIKKKKKNPNKTDEDQKTKMFCFKI